jgi:hypothetical protein
MHMMHRAGARSIYRHHYSSGCLYGFIIHDLRAHMEVSWRERDGGGFFMSGGWRRRSGGEEEGPPSFGFSEGSAEHGQAIFLTVHGQAIESWAGVLNVHLQIECLNLIEWIRLFR